MPNYLSKVISALSNILPKAKIAHSSMILVHIMLGLIIFSNVLYILAWFVQWIIYGKLVLPDLLALVSLQFSPAAVAAIGFYGAALVDKDKDGDPDSFEKEHQA